MHDNLGREIEYLRVSVTDRCNLRCRYCMPQGGAELTEHREILTLEELGRLVDIGTAIGINKVRITGGEPLVRRNITRLVEHIAANPRVKDLAMTTNGIRLPELAAQLKEAGLQRVNISLDTLNPDRYHFITGGGNLDQAREAVDIALTQGFNPVKINTVLIKGFNDDEVDDFVNWAVNEPVHIRFIEFMPVGDLEFWDRSRWIPSTDVLKAISEKHHFVPVDSLIGAGPASVYRPQGGHGTIGFITPMSSHFCHSCNRVRLTAQGSLLGCLHSREGVDVKGPLRLGADDQELKRLFEQAVALKPRGHHLQEGWGQDSVMSQIGG